MKAGIVLFPGINRERDMAIALEGSFGRLRKTLTSFERFVPRKFLAVVAPEGIEFER